MKRTGRSKRAVAQGFTLIELMIAIAILAVVAVLSYRGLEQIIRGREVVSSVMASERVLAQAFDQMASDARAAATDDEAGGSAIHIGGGGCEIVRQLNAPGHATRLQVIRYRVEDRQLVRWASAPIATVGELRASLRGGPGANGGNGWSRVALIHGVSGLNARAWINGVGLSAKESDVSEATQKAIQQLSNPLTSYAPLARAVSGVEVQVVMISNSGREARYVRLYPVGQ